MCIINALVRIDEETKLNNFMNFILAIFLVFDHFYKIYVFTQFVCGQLYRIIFTNSPPDESINTITQRSHAAAKTKKNTFLLGLRVTAFVNLASISYDFK